MREIRESRFFAMGILLIVSAVALLIGAESVRSDGPLPIQRIPLPSCNRAGCNARIRDRDFLQGL